MKSIAAFIGFAVLAFCSACGGGNGGGGGGGPQQDISVSVGPKTANVAGGQTQTFLATILNPNNTGVNWALSSTGCTGSACGSLGNAGGNNNQGWTIDYTAPLTIPSPATVTISATSKDDPSKSDSAVITVTAAVVTVSVSPASPAVMLGATQQLSATVKGTTNTGVTWSLSGPGNVSTSGLYTAPTTLTTPASVTVTATSQADNTKSGTATITIPAVTVAISPSISSVTIGGTQQFTATVTNATKTGVTWSVSGAGTVDTSGLYSTPATLSTPATVTVSAASKADPSKTKSISFSIPAVTIGISPTTPTVILGATQQFTAAVGNAINTAVSWSVAGAGSISASGLYAAPASRGTPASATVTAISVADPSKSISTTIAIPAVSVAVAPTTATLNGGDTQTFTATVTNATNKSVTWSLSGAGMLGTDGKYTAPSIVSTQQTATITATSAADSTKSASAAVTLIPISVAVTPSPVSVPIHTTQQFTATITGTSNTLVTWSVSGTGCSGSDCGTISSTGLYSAPDSVPSPAAVTVKATSAADTTKFGTATVTISDNANSKLAGSFAFTFQGFYGSSMTAIIGSFTADGKGNLTNGLADLNTTSGAPALKQAFTGTYQLHGDNRGTMTLTLPGSPSYRFAVNDSGDRGSVAEMDATGVSGAGLFFKQTTTDFSISKVSGDYAFGFYGNGVDGERNAAVGRLHADGLSAISNGAMDSSSPTSDGITGTFAFSTSTGSGNGRGTMTMVVSGSESGTYHAGFYLVNADKILFLLEDQTSLDVPLLMGELRHQSGSFTASSLAGTAVFYSNGLSTVMGTTKALIGQFAGNGTSSLAGEMAVSDGGTPTSKTAFTASYSITSNGRGTFTSTATGQVVFYLTGGNNGFLLWPTGGGVGMIEPQTLPSGGLKNSDLTGRYLLAGTQVPIPDTGVFTGSVSIDGAGNWVSTADASSPIYPGTDIYNEGTVAVVSATTGRVTMTVTVPSTFNQVIYAATPDRLLVLDLDPSSYNQGAAWQASGFWEK
jgi:uncharacterized protein YjdB